MENSPLPSDITLSAGYPCKKCEKYLTSKRSLENHARTHQKKNPRGLSSPHSTEKQVNVTHTLAGPPSQCCRSDAQETEPAQRSQPQHSMPPLKQKCRAALFAPTVVDISVNEENLGCMPIASTNKQQLLKPVVEHSYCRVVPPTTVLQGQRAVPGVDRAQHQLEPVADENLLKAMTEKIRAGPRSVGSQVEPNRQSRKRTLLVISDKQVSKKRKTVSDEDGPQEQIDTSQKENFATPDIATLKRASRQKNETTPGHLARSGESTVPPLSREEHITGTYLAFIKDVRPNELRRLLKRHPPSRTKQEVLREANGRREVVKSIQNIKLGLLKLYAGGKLQAQASYQENINSVIRHGCRKFGALRDAPYTKVRKFANLQDSRTVKLVQTLDPTTTVNGAYVELQEAATSIIKSYHEMDRKHLLLASKRAAHRERQLKNSTKCPLKNPTECPLKNPPRKRIPAAKVDWPLLSKRFSDKDSDITDVIYNLGADGCPNGQQEMVSLLLSMANLGRRIRSRFHTHLLFGADSSETNSINVTYLRHLAKSVDALEGKIIEVGGKKYRLKFGLLVGDIKWLSFALGELTNGAKFKSPFGNMSKATIDNTNWKLEDDLNVEGFHPWPWDFRVKVAKKVEVKKKKETKRPEITKFIASLDSRQEFVPPVSRLMGENICPDPLHAAINSFGDWFDWLIDWVVNLGSKPPKRSADASNLDAYMEENPNVPLVRLLKKIQAIYFPLFRLFKKRFNSGLPFDKLGLKGNDARALSKHYMQLVAVIYECDEIKRPRHEFVKYQLAAIAFSAKMLSKTCSLASAFDTDEDAIKALEKHAMAYYAINKLMRKKARSLQWHTGVVLPFHARRLFRRFKCSTGAGDCNGREANHTLMKSLSKHASRGPGRWKSIFCHDFVIKQYIPMQFGPGDGKACLSFSPAVLPGHCDCSLKLVGEGMPRCPVCGTEEFRQVARSAREHTLTPLLIRFNAQYELLLKQANSAT